MSKPDKSLKTQNLKWLWAVVTVDALALALIAFPDLLSQTNIKDFAGLRLVGVSMSPVIVLLLTSLIPSEAKASLVFWRVSEILPGHRAFSVHAQKDARINLDALRKNVGEFPIVPKEQNAFWYKLYKKVAAEVSVIQAQREFLLYRELATISLLLVPLVALLFYLSGVGARFLVIGVGLLLGQYAMTALAARNNGISFVTNVLAHHAAKRRI